MRKLLCSLFFSCLILASGCMLSMTHLERGKSYLAQKNYGRAIQELEKASNEKGDIYYYTETYASLGDAYANNSEPAKAVAIYRNALQLLHLKLREIAARRYAIRKELNASGGAKARTHQEADMSLADEEWRLREREEIIQQKLKGLPAGR